MQSTETDNPNPNAHVHDFLEYYVSIKESPRFAVLLTGPWGVGKTYLVKQFFEEKDKSSESPSYIYASLYGVASRSELRRILVSAAYPLFFGKSARVVTSLLNSAAEFLNVKSDLTFEELKNPPKDKIIVVDDLERSNMSVTEALGYLNTLVEHDGYKLIIIGNEDEIPEDQRELYHTTREKLIGQVLEVRSDVEGAYEYFHSKLRTERAKIFFEANKGVVLKIFGQSNRSNLRALEQSLIQFERILDRLPLEYQDDGDAMRELVSLYLVLSLEYRSGNIKKIDLESRMIGYLYNIRQLIGKHSEEKAESDPFHKLSEQYVGVNLRSELLSNETLFQILVNGFIDPQALTSDLLKSEYFSKLQPEEAWRIVWHGVCREPHIFERAKDEFLKAFDTRQYKTPGIILHAVMLRLWLLELGYLNKRRQELVEDAKAYIDAVCEDGAFDEQEPGRRNSKFDRDFEGLGFFGSDTQEFKEIRDYLSVKEADAYNNCRPKWAQKLLDDLSSNPEDFMQQVCYTNWGTNKFIDEPLLQLIDVDQFIEVVLSLEYSGQDMAFMALKMRYKDKVKSLTEPFLSERDWYRRLQKALLTKMSDSSGVYKHRLNLFNDRYFLPILKSEEEE